MPTTYNHIASEETLQLINAALGTTLHGDADAIRAALATTLHADLATTIHADLQALVAAGTTRYDAAIAAANAAVATADATALLEEYDRQVANNVYGGRNLATILAAEIADAGTIYAALHARAVLGNFDGLRIGDWMDVPLTARSGTITQSTVRYVIAAFDHYYNCADSPIGHHIVFVPEAPIDMTGSSFATNTSYIMWNTTATNQGTSSQANPYLNSNLHRWELNEFLGKLPSELQGYLLNHRSLCESRYSASATLNASTGWAWADLGKVWSPSEMEVYGCCAWGTPGYSQGMDSQFPVFRETKNRIMGGRVFWWLRVVSGSSSSNVCIVGSGGDANSYSATNTWVRPRPCFLLG